MVSWQHHMRVTAERRVGEVLQRHRMDPVGRREREVKKEREKMRVWGERESGEGGKEKERLRERRLSKTFNWQQHPNINSPGISSREPP